VTTTPVRDTTAPDAAASRSHRPRGFWAGVRSMCLPVVLLVMALPSLVGQTTTAPVTRSHSSDSPLITWDNLWMVPVGYLVAAAVILAAGWWQARRRRKR
jgi:cell division protein FtsX